MIDDIETGGSGAEAPKHNMRSRLASLLRLERGEVYTAHPDKNPKWYQKLLDIGVEENGVKPVPVELRTQKRHINIFTVYFSCLLCLLPIPTGLLATTVFGLSLEVASAVIIVFAFVTSIPPSFMGVGGYKTGMRQMIQARYSFGLYFVSIPIILNAATLTGFSLHSVIIGGQTIAVVDPDSDISITAGIVIICVISFASALLGYNAVHQWERYQWIPNLVALITAAACAGKHLGKQQEAPPVSVPQAMSYGGLMAGYFLTFGGTVSDYSIYHRPAPKRKIFAYLMAAFITPSVPLLIFGAAIGRVLPNMPSWQESYDSHGIGGLMAEILIPAGGFGKFILVILALSIIGNVAISMYSISLCLQMFLPVFANIHRFVWVAATMAIMVPMAIVVSKEWEESLMNFLALIGYWAGCFDAVVLEELIIFRKMDWSSFNHMIWNVGSKLPSGVPAMAASLLSFGLIIPGMQTAWYTGPIAEKTGDIGFEMAFIVTAILYPPLRWLEIKWRGQL